MLSLEGPNPTSDLGAERSVLGAIFLSAEALDEISHLESRDFYLKRHELIYSVMRYLYDRDKPVDIVTVTEHFQKRNRLDDMGGVPYLAELANSCPTAANIKHYADIVRSRAIRRRGADIGQKIIDLSRDGFESDEEYFAAVDAIVDEIRPQTVINMHGFAETRDEYMKHLRSKAEKLPTGKKQFDDWAGGMWRGWLFVKAGRPGVGKTADALQDAYNIAKHNPQAGPVLIFSQEMSENELKDRMVSMVSQVNYKRLINKGTDDTGFTENEWKRINQAYDELERLPIYIMDKAGITIDEIHATARKFKKRYKKLAMIIVDYLQIMSIHQSKNETRSQAIGRVTSTAKRIARNLNCIFMMLSQLNRESENRDEPKLSDLKESGSIEQDADVVQFLHESGDWEGSAKVINSIFAKGRNVGTYKFRLLFEWWVQHFKELPAKSGGDSGKTNRK